ncbi:MAG: nitroreductase family protein [Oscillospiraceae bacterium]|nr:nitroreductase family protein [Oscillospiraceae bacterium]
MTTNETIECLINRQSCRKYLAKSIDPEIVEAIVTAGTYAPSAGGGQPWTITVLSNKEKLAHFGELMTADLAAHVPGFQPGKIVDNHGTRGHILCGADFAPLLIVVSEAPHQRTPIISSALACENMMIAAQSLGIASCWLGAVTANLIAPAQGAADGDPLLKSLVPEGNVLVGAIAFGYPAPDGFRKPRVPRRQGAVVYLN